MMDPNMMEDNLDNLTPEQIREVNIQIAQEFIESFLDVPANEENIMLVVDCIEKLEDKNNKKEEE